MSHFIERKPWSERNRWGDSDWVRHYLEKAKMSQRAAAKYLEVSERTMRNYCAAGCKVPKAVMLALKALADRPSE